LKRPARVFAALLDKNPQVNQMIAAAGDALLSNGKTWSFILVGSDAEWPEAVAQTLACKIKGLAELDDIVFEPPTPCRLQGAYPGASGNVGAWLRQLLAKAMTCEKKDYSNLRDALLESSPAPRLFFKVLFEEAQEAHCLGKMIQEWEALSPHLPANSPSHFLILVHISDKPEKWRAKIKKALRSLNLPEHVWLPKLESPKKDDVSGWASNHFPDDLIETVQTQTIAAFNGQDAMPHGEIKSHIIKILVVGLIDLYILVRVERAPR
jgi:hypothetical protein